MEKSIKKSMANPMKKQRGMTLISWIIILVFLLFQGVIAMNVLPVYLTDSNVTKIMKALPQDAKAKGLTPYYLKILVAKRLNINSIYSVTAEHITIQSGRGSHIVIIEYEPRGKLIGNLDYIISFRHEAKVSAH
ncbi:MAG: DUF4845 domain-containing protein [Gammaproteobacteria bacterium]|jgi:hypothetical protein|nr:DUF4845 domain-containing protein [Gammaproteobacteria bacterium]